MARTKDDSLRFLRSIERVGDPVHPLSDLYYQLMRRSWGHLIALLAGVYLLSNLIFAGLYLAGGDCIEGAEVGSFADAFFFSVQTMSTIGYGTLSPKGTYANLIVVVESFCGILGVATATGLIFTKFSRPEAKVLFSENALLSDYNGKRCFMFRLANGRANEIVEASLQVAVLKSEVTTEGYSLRRLHEIPLRRKNSPLFALTWVVFHEIDEDSPFAGEDRTSMIADDLRVIVSMRGRDSTFAQEIHARHIYAADKILEDHRFVDVIERFDDGGLRLDYRSFHETEAIEKNGEAS